MHITDFKVGEKVVWFKAGKNGYRSGVAKIPATVAKIAKKTVIIDVEIDGKPERRKVSAESLEKVKCII